ncbi:conserved hypothetical protein [Pediculus humanus corporis]|uniref:CHK kinase-like domain-containing protein n=1 Tax=Pediculus humanus subsp. corporis TaxID=121224 RepID=E0VEM8_PEDHC|nr:uncharacterized protein Phum_PHUM136540 [Pediculus humanus corporis]EEB11834.1 conserved hypothetical protein [Pediculus humanus corporis]
MKEQELLKWFQNDVIPSILSYFHSTKKYISPQCESCHFENIQQGIDNFASNPFFGEITIKNSIGSFPISFFIKFQNQDPIIREKMKTVVQFQNEVTFYTIVKSNFIQFLTEQDINTDFINNIIPECYYASIAKNKPEESIIVLQDLRKLEFKTAENKVELDLNHCLIALEQLAKFHAISFAMKYLNWQNFDKLKTSFEHVWFSDDMETRVQCQEFKGYCALRGINYLLSQKESLIPKDYLENFKKKFERVFDLMKDAVSPKEPMAVICHGDFNRNNIVFKYSEGKPTQAMLIDFQTYLYSSPCLDVSFFIYMNTTQELRSLHFDKIFKHYYMNLIKAISTLTHAEEQKIINWIPFCLFEKEFERTSLNAYVTISFFMPIMMAPVSNSLDDILKSKTFKEMAEENYNQGGDVGFIMVK